MKPIRSAIVVVIAILFAGSAFAQGRARLDGRVVGPDGQPLAGVAITAQKAGAQERAEAKSNEKGEFSLQKLSNGLWELQFEHAEFEAEPANVEVANNKAPEITVTMAPPDPRVAVNAELQRAAGLMQSGDIPGARAIYEGLYAKYPQPFQFPFAIATTYAAEKNYEKAMEFAKIAEEKEPGSVEVKMLVAEIHMEAGRHEEARVILEGIDLKQVEDPVLFINSGIVLINAGKADDAIRIFDRLIERFPTLHQLHYYRGRANLAGEKLTEARADFEKFISLAPADSKEVADAKNIIAEIDKQKK